jgi:tRNA nucleotidyltransferase/poly(A) polymerase
MSLRDELLRRFPPLRGLALRIAPLYVVGGAVRDLLRGAVPADVDLASLDPAVAAGLLGRRVITLGRDHLTACRVTRDGHVYDFAALLGGAIGPDLARRDCTVNAMAIDLAGGALLDPHGGQEDLRRKLVRMVRAVNFDDDPLRVLKGVRMAVTLGFEIEEETLAAMKARAPLVGAVPVERITFELGKILGGGSLRKALSLLRAAGLDEPLGLERVEVQADDVPLAAALAIVVREPRAYGERWRWSAALIRDVSTLARLRRQHDRVALFHAGERVAMQLPALLAAVGEERTLDLPDFSIVPLLDGAAIAAATGLAPGPKLGALKRALLDAQLLGQVTTHAEAAAFVRAKMPR